MAGLLEDAWSDALYSPSLPPAVMQQQQADDQQPTGLIQSLGGQLGDSLNAQNLSDSFGFTTPGEMMRRDYEFDAPLAPWEDAEEGGLLSNVGDYLKQFIGYDQPTAPERARYGLQLEQWDEANSQEGIARRRLADELAKENPDPSVVQQLAVIIGGVSAVDLNNKTLNPGQLIFDALGNRVASGGPDAPPSNVQTALRYMEEHNRANPNDQINFAQAFDRTAKVIKDVGNAGAVATATAEGTGLGQSRAEMSDRLTDLPINYEDGKVSRKNIENYIGMLSSGELDTGRLKTFFKNAFNLKTNKDGMLDAAAVGSVIDQIQKATFGALSQSELDLLRQMFADPYANKDENIGRLQYVLGKIDIAQERLLRQGGADLEEMKSFNPDRYKVLSNRAFYDRQYGRQSEVPQSVTNKTTGIEVSVDDYLEDAMGRQGLSKDEALDRWEEYFLDDTGQ